jgi:uncharacterized membrane protein YciS (DUF1049 family)
MVKAFTLILIMATLVVAIIFSSLNFNPVEIHYLFDRGSLPLAVLLAVAFILGFVLGLLFDAWMLYRQRVLVGKLERQVKAYESEVSNLRKLPLKDFHG